MICRYSRPIVGVQGSQAIHTIFFFVLFVLPRSDADEVTFKKQQITDRCYCDSVNVADINSDVHVDIITGTFLFLQTRKSP